MRRFEVIVIKIFFGFCLKTLLRHLGNDLRSKKNDVNTRIFTLFNTIFPRTTARISRLQTFEMFSIWKLNLCIPGLSGPSPSLIYTLVIDLFDVVYRNKTFSRVLNLFTLLINHLSTLQNQPSVFSVSQWERKNSNRFTEWDYLYYFKLDQSHPIDGSKLIV